MIPEKLMNPVHFNGDHKMKSTSSALGLLALVVCLSRFHLAADECACVADVRAYAASLSHPIAEIDSKATSI